LNATGCNNGVPDASILILVCLLKKIGDGSQKIELKDTSEATL
jgi:hypothetical protein